MEQENTGTSVGGSTVTVPEKSKRKANVPAIILGIMTVIFAGLAGYFGMKCFTDEQAGGGESDGGDESEVAGDSTGNQEAETQIASSAMAEDYDEVWNEILKITDGVADKWDYIENDEGLMYKPEGLNTYVPMKLDLIMKIKTGGSEKRNSKDFYSGLEKAGYKSIGTLPSEGSAGPRIDGFLNNDKNIVCGTYDGNDGQDYYMAITCAKTDWVWLTKEKIELVGELETAYFEKTGGYPSNVYGLVNEIKDSQYAPYQTLQVLIGGGVALFYRVSPDAKWQYFTGGQSLLGCDEYNTEDLKKAFAGDTCFDDSNDESTVQP